MFKLEKIENHNIYRSTLVNMKHFFTTRDLIVKDNLELVADYLSIVPSKIIKPRQTHSDNIKIVDSEINDYDNCDSLILAKSGYAIYLNFADCTPVMLFDEKNNISSIAHAGWRGTAQKIAAKTALKMREVFNSDFSELKALIGPCISFSMFETYNEALEQLKASVDNKEGLFQGNFADLKGINKRQLLELGLKSENIDVCPFCTVLDNDKFFSYRKEDKTKNRHSAVAAL